MPNPFPTAAAFLPPGRGLRALQKAAQECEGCPLYARATQTVFGAGPAKAQAMFVGEQPGDAEDAAGKPFVGPAGRMLDEVLAEVGIDRRAVYVTNAVKHFKWTPRGKRRMHSKPNGREIEACKPWLQAEILAVRPDLLIVLGATAAQALLGRKFRITKQRGEPFESEWADWTLATYHPSAVLRAKYAVHDEQMYQQFQADLQLVSDRLRELG
jgi:DNA polymerase